MTTMHDINIRATADERFWGNAYPDSVYLWTSSKNNLTLREFDASGAGTMEDPFPSKKSVQEAHDFCRAAYYKYLGILSAKLNEIHGLDVPETFWRTVFGSWLYRHVSIVYDKFVSLRRIDIDRTSITLLSPGSFYIPYDHFDHIRCFCNDHGVLQLVSQYYTMFATTEFPTASAQCNQEILRRNWNNPHGNLIVQANGDAHRPTDPDQSSPDQTVRIALCSAYYPKSILDTLSAASDGMVSDIALPPVAANKKELDWRSRELLAKPHSDDAFERYLDQSLLYCMPQILVEYFNDYYHAYSRHVEASQHDAIVTECWISFMPVSIYCAIARHKKNVRLILQHHGASNQWHYCNVLWIEKEVADSYITSGYPGDTANCVVGGFAIREPRRYQFETWKSDILHVTTTRFPYLLSCGDYAHGGERFLRYLRGIDALIDMIPARLKEHYVLRPRREELLLDTEHTWDVTRRVARIEGEGDLLPLLLGARLVIIDHMSTGLAELLTCRIPFVLLYIEEFEFLSEAYAGLFDDLIACGVVHKSPASLADHVDRVYDDVQSWWQSGPVQRAIDQIIGLSLGPPHRTTDYLLSLLQTAK